MKNVAEHDLSIDDTVKWTFVLVCLVLLIVSLSWGSDKYTSSSSGFTVAIEQRTSRPSEFVAFLPALLLLVVIALLV